MKLYFLPTLLLAATAHAQSLSAFLASADRQNIDVQLSEEVQARAWADSASAWSGLLPALVVSGGYTFNQYPSVVSIPDGAGASGLTYKDITITPQHQLEGSARLEVPLIDASKWFRVSAQRTAAEASEVKALATRSAVQRSVVTAFHALAGAEAVLGSAERALAAAQKNLDYLVARSELGSATELDRERAAAEVERTRQLLAEAQTSIQVNKRSLQTLSGLEPGVLVAEAADPLTEEAPLPQLMANLSNVPAARGAELDAVAAQRQSQAAWGLMAPTVTAQATERLTNATGFQGQSALFSAGVNLSWRLDLTGVQGIRGQLATAAQARLEAQKQKQRASDQLHQDWWNVHSALVKVKAARVQEKSAQRAAAVARERFREGAATQLDVISADRDQLSAEVTRIQAESALAISRHQVRLSAGLPLEVAP